VGDPLRPTRSPAWHDPLVQENQTRPNPTACGNSGANAHLPLGLFRRVPVGPAPLVRHGELRQPGQGRPTPRQGEGGHDAISPVVDGSFGPPIAIS
jgi:hypothetical protein